MTMPKFADQLFTDLMAEYRPTLEQTELARPPMRRSTKPAWLTSGLATLGALLTTILLLVTSGGPAYAVTKNPDGTITVTLNQMAALAQAAAALNKLGPHTAIGCTSSNADFPAALPNSVTIDPAELPVDQPIAVVAAPGAAGLPEVTWVELPAHAQGCAEVFTALADARKAAQASGGK
jgi:hypothetical protein